MQSSFANVERHNGLEAWRKIAEPVNDDKALVLQELLAPVTNPKGATTMAGFADALKLWDTNIRLFTAAGGEAPRGDAQRIAFIKLLPPSVAAHVTLYSDNFTEFGPLKRFALKYIKINMGLDAQRSTSRAVKLVDLNNQPAPGSWSAGPSED